MSERPPVRVAIVGCGAIAHTHAAILRQLPAAELVMACEPDPARREEFADNFGIPGRVAAVREVAASPDVDAAFVCTPHQVRLPIIGALADAGKSIFSEKPLTHDILSLRKLARILAVRPTHFWSGYKLRFYSLIEAAAAAVPDPELIQVSVFDDPWEMARTSPASGGGNLRAQGVYAAEMLRLLGHGVPRAVSAVGHGARHGDAALDRLCASFEFASGACAGITVGDAGRLPSPVSKFSASVVGGGRAACLNERFTSLVIRDTETGDCETREHPEDGFERQCAAFIHACQTGFADAAYPDFRYGAAPSIMIEAAIEAALSGQRQFFDIDAWLSSMC